MNPPHNISHFCIIVSLVFKSISQIYCQFLVFVSAVQEECPYEITQNTSLLTFTNTVSTY